MESGGTDDTGFFDEEVGVGSMLQVRYQDGNFVLFDRGLGLAVTRFANLRSADR